MTRINQIKVYGLNPQITRNIKTNSKIGQNIIIQNPLKLTTFRSFKQQRS